jgi:pimeloyl-ACP methyl ester carboxylesterase
LECPFTSIMRVVSNSVLARPIDMFKNIDKIDQVRFPVLILHGTEDDVVPFDHGKALWEKIPDKYRYEPQWVRGGTHHNLIELLTVKGYITVLATFLKQCQSFVDERDRDGMIQETTRTRSSSWFSFASPSN